MKVNEIIIEAPLVDYEPIGFGQNKKGGFRREVDTALVTHPTVIGKVKKFFSRSHNEFRLFPVQFKGGAKYLETGSVNVDELIKILGKDNSKRILDGHNKDTITIVYSSNIGANLVPMTPWIMAHRIGHVIRIKNPVWDLGIGEFFKAINYILTYYYNIPVRQGKSMDFEKSWAYRSLFTEIGTMRSARQNLLPRPYEFVYELLAQYINLGVIQFNPAPQTLFSSRKAWGKSIQLKNIDNQSQYEANQALQILSRDLEIYFNNILTSAEGKIFVM